LIGRDHELDVLHRLIANIKDEGASVVVRGQPGVGKSSLLRAASEIALMAGASCSPRPASSRRRCFRSSDCAGFYDP
jgi:ABC-type uncharacterized transport system fused permease/ATPase subunit